jgi:thiol:disulfide interchange protein
LWDVKAGYQARGGIAMPGQQVLVLACSNKPGVPPVELGHTYFFPEQGNVVDPNENNVSKPASDQKFSAFNYILDLQQNGEKAARISGVLVSDRPLIGKSKAVSLAPVATNSNIPPLSWAGIGKVENGGGGALASPIASASIGGENSPARSAAATTEAAASPIEAQPFLIAVLGAAFVGGLILNLMPCVLPVLSLKVFSLIRHAGDESGGAWKQGVAFTVGVVISFWILAGLLIALRAAGDHLGWGFQMQSPGFVLALIFLFFLLGLNLFGVFELGTSLVGLDAKAAGQAGSGLASSFLNGVLATIAATPCTAPFMGSSVGFAAEQPAYIALLIFTVLALGMATPYLLLTIFPGALRFVPKPGAWMEALKQFMGFLLLATVIFLIYVFGALVGTKQIPMVLFCLLLAGIGAWIYGRWGTLRALLYVFALAAGLYALKLDAGPLFDLSSGVDQKAEAANGWQPWTTGAVNRALTQKRPVFVDFTAAWCLSCKVNEQLALETDEVRQAFTRKNVALFRADWTHSDPKISEVLAQYHRDGVPLYLLYAPGEENSPQVLPEVLTPGIVVNALERLP